MSNEIKDEPQWVLRVPSLQNTNSVYPDFYQYRAYFSAEECKEFIKYCENHEVVNSNMQWGDKKQYQRDTDISWIYPNEQNKHLFEKVADFIAKMNNSKFNYDLYGYMRAFQYGVYNKGQGYDWHQDLGKDNISTRKLTISIQLSSPKEYEGGELEFFRSDDVHARFDKTLGSIAIFPSWIMHRVTPVTKGIRKSLVYWVEGPPFR